MGKGLDWAGLQCTWRAEGELGGCYDTTSKNPLLSPNNWGFETWVKEGKGLYLLTLYIIVHFDVKMCGHRMYS